MNALASHLRRINPALKLHLHDAEIWLAFNHQAEIAANHLPVLIFILQNDGLALPTSCLGQK